MISDREKCHAQALSRSFTAVGSLAFVDNVRSELGIKAMHREVAQLEGTYILREQSEAYGEDFASENDSLTLNNTISWEENIETAET